MDEGEGCDWAVAGVFVAVWVDGVAEVVWVWAEERVGVVIDGEDDGEGVVV